MSNRRQLVVLAMFAFSAVVAGSFAAYYDEHKGWGDPGQAVANLASIVGLLCIIGAVGTLITLLARDFRDRHATH